MKRLIVALIMVVPFAGMGQKIESVLKKKVVFTDPDSCIRGNVKFIRIKGGIISKVWGKPLWDRFYKDELISSYHKNDSIVYSNKGLIKEQYHFFDSSNNLSDKYVCEYDSFNNLIKEITTRSDSVKQELITYKYDSNGNCIEHTIYNKFSKKTYTSTEEIKQIDNGISEYVYTIDSIGKRHLFGMDDTEFDKNKETINKYNAEGKLTCISVKETDKNATKIEYTLFPENGKASKLSSTITKRGNKRILEETWYGKLTHYEETTLNSNGDASKVHIKRYEGDKEVANYVITYTYEYDSKGNYTKKTIYLENKPIIEIKRVIGYYD